MQINTVIRQQRIGNVWWISFKRICEHIIYDNSSKRMTMIALYLTKLSRKYKRWKKNFFGHNKIELTYILGIFNSDMKSSTKSS